MFMSSLSHKLHYSFQKNSRHLPFDINGCRRGYGLNKPETSKKDNQVCQDANFSVPKGWSDKYKYTMDNKFDQQNLIKSKHPKIAFFRGYFGNKQRKNGLNKRPNAKCPGVTG
jgi:hypothetical protein